MPESYESILGTKPLMYLWEYLSDTQLATPLLAVFEDSVVIVNILVLMM